jgi:hypothetical protein
MYRTLKGITGLGMSLGQQLAKTCVVLCNIVCVLAVQTPKSKERDGKEKESCLD